MLNVHDRLQYSRRYNFSEMKWEYFVYSTTVLKKRVVLDDELFLVSRLVLRQECWTIPILAFEMLFTHTNLTLRIQLTLQFLDMSDLFELLDREIIMNLTIKFRHFSTFSTLLLNLE